MSKHRFTITERRLLDPGWLTVHGEKAESAGHLRRPAISKLEPGQRVKAKRVQVKRHLPPAPSCMTEADLIAALKARSIGRPATYALIVESLIERKYVKRNDAGALEVTRLGREVGDFLAGAFPEIFEASFTAEMEKQLDDVADGQATYEAVLKTFWSRLVQGE